MITTTTNGRLQAVSIDGGPTVAVLDERALAYGLDGQDYVVRKLGAATPSYDLYRGDERLALVSPHWPRDRYTLTVGERSWTLQREGFGARRYGVFDGKARVGEIKSARRWFCADLVADLPPALPREVQVFLVWFALWQFDKTGD